MKNILILAKWERKVISAIAEEGIAGAAKKLGLTVNTVMGVHYSVRNRIRYTIRKVRKPDGFFQS